MRQEEPILITKLGKSKLEARLGELKEELRLTYIKRREAAEEGDLKENSAYIYAGQKADLLNSQIEEAAQDLANLKIIESPGQNRSIEFGHRVVVVFEEDGREMGFTLVGKHDARLKEGWIYYQSPIGEALLGKKAGEKVEVNGQTIRIVSIEAGDI